MESLPLKYLILILVAVIVIGTVLTITQQFAGNAATGADQLSQTLGSQLNATTKDACESVAGCQWNETCVCE